MYNLYNIWVEYKKDVFSQTIYVMCREGAFNIITITFQEKLHNTFWSFPIYSASMRQHFKLFINDLINDLIKYFSTFLPTSLDVGQRSTPTLDYQGCEFESSRRKWEVSRIPI